MTRSLALRVAAALVALLGHALLGHAPLRGQEPAPLLTLDAALTLAQQQNRVLKAERLGADKADQQLAAFRTQKRPLFDVRVTSGSLLAPLDFRFPAGAFGVFPTTGPIPPAQTTITTNPGLTAVVFANVTQPLTQLPRLGRGERAVALGRDVATEQARARELEVIANVRSLYYGIVQAEAAMRARHESVRLFQELQRLTDRYVAEQVVLPDEALTVRAGLLQQEHEILVLRHAATDAREKLNALLARALDEPFQVEPLRPAAMDDTSLRAAEERAGEARPEVRIRRLQAEQAGFDLRASATPGMPDVSASFSYAGFWGFQVLPRHGAMLGVLAAWEPWDWGRRKAEREGKRVTLAQAELAVTEAAALVRVDVRSRFRAVQEAFARLPVCEAGRDAARERLRVATARVSQEAALERAVLEAQTRVAQADFDCQKALADYWTAQAELERARADQ